MSININYCPNLYSFIDDVNNTTITVSSNNSLSHSVLTSDLYSSSGLQKIISTNLLSQDTGIMPPGVLFVKKNSLVFERPPAYQNVFFIPKRLDDSDYSEEPVTSYRILVPWQLYIVHFSDNYRTNAVRIHFMNSSLQHLDQEVYMAPMANLYSSGDLCRPMFDSIEDIERYTPDHAGVIASAYDWVWNSGTNVDLTESIVHYYKQMFSTTDKTSFIQKSTSIELRTIVETFSSYYCSSNLVKYLYQSWEQNVNFDNLYSFSWPSNSKNYNFRQDYAEAVASLYPEYIRQHPSRYSSGSCCEDCSGYDEESDTYYSYDECECSCHENYSPDRDFYVWAGFNSPPPLTFIQSYQSFLSNHIASYSYDSSSLNYVEDYFFHLST